MTFLYGKNEAELSSHLKNVLDTTSKEAIAARNIFKIGVSGGSALKFITNALKSMKDADFSKWKFFFCDERVVPECCEDSTYGAYKQSLISTGQLTEAQFVKIKQGLSADATASDYIRQMEQFFPANALPVFDFLLLGMGPDGHTCSLFPGHKLLNESSVWVAPITDSPKPPPCRITLTMPVVNNARNCAFVIAGKDKAPIAMRAFVDKEELLPAARVNPKEGKLYVIIEDGLIN